MTSTFAAQTLFGERIAHGMHLASFISTVFGTLLPGPGCIYLSQNLRFTAPVKVGDTVEARVTIKKILQDRRRVLFDTICMVKETAVLDGEAWLMVNRRAKSEKTVAA